MRNLIFIFLAISFFLSLDAKAPTPAQRLQSFQYTNEDIANKYAALAELISPYEEAV